MLKRISTQARQGIEALLGLPVYLALHVKVSRDWRKNDSRLREFGYEPPSRDRRRRP
jgi:GTP-binding protein Era